jgi:single-stranded-DNA-specific exonuclease
MFSNQPHRHPADIREILPPIPVHVTPPPPLNLSQLQSMSVLESQGCNPLEAEFCIRREVANPQRFLNSGFDSLSGNLDLHGVDTAVALVQREVYAKRPIFIASDFDADGITAAVIISKALQSLGVTTIADTPCRHTEGYGLNKRLIDTAVKQQCRLLFALDFGTSQAEIVEYAKRQGIEVVVIDHHKLPRSGPPPASAFVNPQAEGISFTDMCAAGLCWMFARELSRQYPGASMNLAALSQIAAVGTVADVVPLRGDNRTLVRSALESAIIDPSLALLISETGLPISGFSSAEIGFILGPVLNAPGRMAPFGARECLELLCAESSEPKQLSKSLIEWNRLRKERVDNDFQIALKQVAQRPMDRAIVVASPHFDPGVAGIVASRLTEHLQRPSAVIAWCEKAGGRASVRSGFGFNAFHALDTLQQSAAATGRRQFERFGGHAAAAGFTLRQSEFESFRSGFIRQAEYQLGPFKPLGRTSDFSIDLSSLCKDATRLLQALRRCEPYGQGNDAPIWYVDAVRIDAVRRIGADHLLFELSSSGSKINGYLWHGAAHPLQGQVGRSVPLGVKLSELRLPDSGGTRKQVALEIVGVGKGY